AAGVLHLALKAFYPSPLPFPLLHVDTGWKFKDMYAFRARMHQEHHFNLLIHQNPEGLAMGINPFTHGSQVHTDIMKTQGLKQALDQHQFDAAFGGATLIAQFYAGKVFCSGLTRNTTGRCRLGSVVEVCRQATADAAYCHRCHQ
ncbi:MAG: hypothetical protein RJA02_1188, partial [Armatimonadota bacterium]